MADAKIQALSRKLIFALLVVFPFGQLFRLNLVPQLGLRIQPIDVLAFFAIPLLLFLKRKNKTLLKASLSLLFVFIFSLVIYLVQVGISFVALAYLLRFTAYLALFNLAAVAVKSPKFKATVINSLLTVVVFSGILGWYQYFIYPDFRPFKIVGWDDHLFRLVGSFFDPGFLGIVLVLGFILSLGLYLTQKRKKILVAALFLLVTIAFTYSRASYLAVVAGTLTLFYLKKYKSILFISLLGVFTVLVLLLPRPSSEGVKLERVASIGARAVNYGQTLLVWKLSPVFGVGFNNMCLVRQTLVADEDYASHSCSGADSSLLFVLATTGIVGAFAYVVYWGRIFSVGRESELGQIAIASVTALLVHSQFTNSLFYPWVLVWFALLLGAKTKGSNKA